MRQPKLWPLAWSLTALAGAALSPSALWLAAHRRRLSAGPPAQVRGRASLPRQTTARLRLATACPLTGLALASARDGWRLNESLDPALEGRDLPRVGEVQGLPDASLQRWRFAFEVESSRRPDGSAVRVPERVLPGRYVQPGAPPLPGLRPGSRWQWPARLKRPHGLSNPDGLGCELCLLEQRVRATGCVRSDKSPAPVRFGAVTSALATADEQGARGAPRTLVPGARWRR